MAYRQLLFVLKPNSSLSFFSVKNECPSRTECRSYGSSTEDTSKVRSVIDFRSNKELGYTHLERQRLNLLGLLPCAHRTLEEQVYAINMNLKALPSNLCRYVYLHRVRERQERLFYHYVARHVRETLPIIYTPTVGEACLSYSQIYDCIKGIFLTKYDKGHMADVLRNWPEKNIQIACVTDGERILGLGDLGANGMGISVGKLNLYTVLGGIPPHLLVPIVLDVGTNNKKLLCDPMYVGVREQRCTGAEYEELVDEFMDSVIQTWGYKTLIHFEDFATPNALKFIKKYQEEYCYINDDIQGTGAIALAGFLAVERISKVRLEDQVILLVGGGSACLGTGHMIIQELISRKLSEEEALRNIYMTNVNGLITTQTKKFSFEAQKKYAKNLPPEKDLATVVANLKPSILLGATGQGGLFTKKIIRSMAKHHKLPAIFACSNPTQMSECTAEQAYKHTNGRVLFASGSPFPPVVLNGRRLNNKQINNALAFPGVGLGVICTMPKTVPDQVFLVAAHAIAKCTEEQDPEALYPDVKDASKVAFRAANAVAQYLIDKGSSTLYPEPADICTLLKSFQYNTKIESPWSETWKYPHLTRVPLPKKEKKC